MQPKQFFQKHLLFYSLVYAFAFAAATGCVKEIQSVSDETETSIVSSAAETTPPTVNFTYPTAESIVSGTITINVSATDNSGIASVLVKVDGVKLGKKTTAPYNFIWNTASVVNGTHILLAKAVDALGNARTRKITVKVLNDCVKLPQEEHLFLLINAERVSRGLMALAWNCQLHCAATRHVVDMTANHFIGHTGSDGSFLSDRVTDCGYLAIFLRENLSGGPTKDGAQAVFDSWMENTEQRVNLLSSSALEIGVAHFYDLDDITFKHYWVAVFGNRQ